MSSPVPFPVESRRAASPRRRRIVRRPWHEVNEVRVWISPNRTARDSLLQSAAGGRRVRPLSVMKTYTAKPGEIQREWFLVDAEGQTLGRLATRIADTLD